jgi:hypothetical protein
MEQKAALASSRSHVATAHVERKLTMRGVRSYREVTSQEALDKKIICQDATLNPAEVECRQWLDDELVIPGSSLSTVFHKRLPPQLRSSIHQ